MSFIEAKSKLPVIIQGGMGVGVSNWQLARAVALAGEELNQHVLGVVSGTGIEALLARRLQDGDTDGHMRRALAAFPFRQIAESLLDEYFYNVVKPPSSRYRLTPKPGDLLSRDPERVARMNNLSVAANFVEVWLAKEGHDRPIGINHLEKIQLLHLPRLYGAMLAGVDYVIEGAGIPAQVPGVLDLLSSKKPAKYRIDVAGSKTGFEVIFDPSELSGGSLVPPIERPSFLAVIASNLLAKILASRITGFVDGFVVEGPTAGGHNAPPRGKFGLNARGEPIYGEKDKVNLTQLVDLQRPFWLAGSYASPAKLAEAIANGASGIQAGTIFALCEQSGLRSDLKELLRKLAREGRLDVQTSTSASPTGFPLKVAQVDGTLSEKAIFDARVRRCTAGHLIEVYQTKRGSFGVRCPAEPIDAYAQKGGKRGENTGGSVCICNGLTAAAGYGQTDKLGFEPPIVTLGDDTGFISQMPEPYNAKDAVRYLLRDQIARSTA